jgi:hypothetical protein
VPGTPPEIHTVVWVVVFVLWVIEGPGREIANVLLLIVSVPRSGVQLIEKSLTSPADLVATTVMIDSFF